MAAAEQGIAALTAQVAELAKQVRGIAQRETAVEAIFQAGVHSGPG